MGCDMKLISSRIITMNCNSNSASRRWSCVTSNGRGVFFNLNIINHSLTHPLPLLITALTAGCEIPNTFAIVC